ncbi:MAG: VOC family protein [Staphylococcus equorum]|uniref:VOC family protein n=1 Tax=Staphylococcus TaxID=1279 RepID=UPI0008533AC6|nr:VOC family protein [Staphylococcus equorum]MDG0823296.1 VOC family protein [Staphylococcus equorum]MDG0836882.1 VOC family protein [Staphylococcus equorum]MDK9871473.1 VOC family protein [Staphylococcus equorum]MDK9877957.1 VOC family protein [Staphylococcus equorum]MDN5809173.1 VOC family protein [Staphylococcus equorum]
MNIVGHHHISMYTKDAQINKDFYTQILGLRLVEKSVNQDNPTMYHLFFGDEIGSVGTLLSFFEIPNVGKNRPGTNSIHRLSLLVPNEAALSYFKSRLTDANITTTDMTYLNQPALLFKDVDNLEIVLLVNDDYKIPTTWRKNPYTDVPVQHQILGMGPVELRVRKAQPTIDFLKNELNYALRQDTDETVMTLDQEGLYTDFVVIEQQGERARPGQGYVHHIAVNTPKDSNLEAVLNTINHNPGNNSGIIDRYFFKSLYYRHNSIMYEFATASPGFTVDTDIENLGKQLNLPDFMENQRTEIESKLHDL